VPKLRNWQHERFAQEIAAGTDAKEAYVLAGYMPSSVAGRNHNRLLRSPDIAARIDALRQEREDNARAAGVSAASVLAVFQAHGIERLDEFFERDVPGVLCVRDLRAVPVEASIALMRFLNAGLGLRS
jgi:phage terminase small subunit